jgi:hypothetical protein
MYSKLIFAVIAGLGIGATSVAAQPPLLPPPLPSPQPQVQGYHVQFRQTYWREQEFTNPADMDAFVAAQRSNGWDVQVLSSPDGNFLVRYRLMRWGGSRDVSTLLAAQLWAQSLAAQGYEPRIVPYP